MEVGETNESEISLRRHLATCMLNKVPYEKLYARQSYTARNRNTDFWPCGDLQRRVGEVASTALYVSNRWFPHENTQDTHTLHWSCDIAVKGVFHASHIRHPGALPIPMSHLVAAPEPRDTI